MEWVVRQPACIPRGAYQPGHSRDGGGGVMFVLILGLWLAIVVELLDTTLRTTEDVQKYTGFNTIGIIPRKK